MLTEELRLATAFAESLSLDEDQARGLLIVLRLAYNLKECPERANEVLSTFAHAVDLTYIEPHRWPVDEVEPI